jgi:hypothetical protein
MPIEDKKRANYGKYDNFNPLNQGSVVVLKYQINIPMSTFNIFDKLRYLPKFFGNSALDIIPTLDNMIMKVVDFNVEDQLGCYHPTKQRAYNCYGF